MCPRFDSWWHHVKQEPRKFCEAFFVIDIVEQRTDRVKALCPRFDSWWHHPNDSSENLGRFSLVEQRTGRIEILALCPRFDSWWHHLKASQYFCGAFTCKSASATTFPKNSLHGGASFLTCGHRGPPRRLRTFNAAVGCYSFSCSLTRRFIASQSKEAAGAKASDFM